MALPVPSPILLSTLPTSTQPPWLSCFSQTHYYPPSLMAFSLIFLPPAEISISLTFLLKCHHFVLLVHIISKRRPSPNGTINPLPCFNFFIVLVTIWMSVCHPNSYVEILMPNVMVLGGGAFGRCLGHEDGALMNGISALIKETPESPLALPTMWGHSKKSAVYSPEEGLHRNLTMLVPQFWTSSLQNQEK